MLQSLYNLRIIRGAYRVTPRECGLFLFNPGKMYDQTPTEGAGKEHPPHLRNPAVPKAEGSCCLPDTSVRDRTDGGPSLPESTTDDNHGCNQPRHLYCSPKARDTNNRIMLRHRVPLTASSGRFLTRMEERTRLWPVVVVWVGMRLRSRIGVLRCRRG